MGSKTKIFVVKAKEILYTGIFVVLGILLILLLIYMFFPKDDTNSKSVMKYVPGVYSQEIVIGDSTLNLSVTVDKDTISSVELTNLDESVTAMYPLLDDALEEINQQISTVDSIDELTYSTSNQYTSILLTKAIKEALLNAQAVD